MVMRTHNSICHLCGHSGSDEIDHIIGVAQWRREQRIGDPNHPSNLAPAHGAPCPTCGRTCHKDKTQREAAQARWGGRRQTEQHPGIIDQADYTPTPQPKHKNYDRVYERARRQLREGGHPGII